KLALRCELADEQDAKDAETLVRAGLYVVRQSIQRLPAQAGLDSASQRKFAPTLRKAEAALRAAAVTRKKTTLTGSVRFKPDAADLVALTEEVRKASERMKQVNNLKQIAIAMHNYNDVYNGMVGPAIYDKAGKPLLSWRVAILPYIEQQNLYQQFK